MTLKNQDQDATARPIERQSRFGATMVFDLRPPATPGNPGNRRASFDSQIFGLVIRNRSTNRTFRRDPRGQILLA